MLFAQIVQLCRQLDMDKLGNIAIDGTKIKANASEATLMIVSGSKKR